MFSGLRDGEMRSHWGLETGRRLQHCCVGTALMSTATASPFLIRSAGGKQTCVNLSPNMAVKLSVRPGAARAKKERTRRASPARSLRPTLGPQGDSVERQFRVSSPREFRVVMRGPSAAVFRPNKNFVFERFPTNLGPVNIAYTSRWVKRSETVTIPGHLWVEIRGFAPDLETAIGPFANAGLAGISVIATSTNAGTLEASTSPYGASRPDINL